MSTKEFHISTSKELIAIKDRVRNLINHWGEDGRYKEAVLKSIIERFLPAKFKIASGFVVKQTENRGDHIPSTQIDLLIYDSAFPVLFKESDFVIVTPDAVQAIIEVKANLKNQGLERILKKSNHIGQFIYSGKLDRRFPLFNGIFSFEGFERLNSIGDINELFNQSIAELATQPFLQSFRVNHISFNKDKFYKFWGNQQEQNPHFLYSLPDLSFSFFISNLMDHLSKQSVIQNNFIWFPVDKSLKVIGSF
jgi:hypothetical protein